MGNATDWQTDAFNLDPSGGDAGIVIIVLACIIGYMVWKNAAKRD